MSADGYVPSFDGRLTVTEEQNNRVEPIGVESRGGADFEIERSVTWAAVGGDPESYKVVVVVVRWDVASGERTVTLQTGRYEGAPVL